MALAWATATVAAAGHAQEPVPVFKASTTLIRVDVVVTDKKGAQVRDLTAADFEVEADGKAVPVKVASYVPVLVELESPPGTATPSGGTRRVLAFYVSIPVVSFEMPMESSQNTLKAGDSSRRAAKMLAAFLKTQRLPTDLVSIARADTTTFETLADFSDSEETLDRAAVRVGQTAAEAVSSPLRVYLTPSTGYRDVSALVDRNIGVLSTMDKMITAMEALPGRRLLFFVGGLQLDGRPREGPFEELNQLVRAVVEHANRAEVTLFGIHPGGARGGSIQGLDTLASGTGGSVIGHTELLSENLGKILNSNLGYYSLGYEPATDTSRAVQKIRVRVKRTGVRVSARPVAFVKELLPPQ